MHKTLAVLVLLGCLTSGLCQFTLPTEGTPVTDPPATDPPATDPPATDPPATDPPATDPPATDPPATEPSEVPTEEPEATSVSTEETTTTNLLVPCDMECPDENGNFEYEPCGTLFCSCTNGIGYEQECVGGLVFNPEDEICDWPYNNPDCDEYEP